MLVPLSQQDIMKESFSVRVKVECSGDTLQKLSVGQLSPETYKALSDFADKVSDSVLSLEIGFLDATLKLLSHAAKAALYLKEGKMDASIVDIFPGVITHQEIFKEFAASHDLDSGVAKHHLPWLAQVSSLLRVCRPVGFNCLASE